MALDPALDYNFQHNSTTSAPGKLMTNIPKNAQEFIAQFKELTGREPTSQELWDGAIQQHKRCCSTRLGPIMA